jgi:hypothetical protein
MTVLIGLISVDLLTRGVFSEKPRISKSFKLSNFLAPQSRGRITGVVETERHIFIRKRIVTLSFDVHKKLDVAAHANSHRFPLLLSSPLLSHSLFCCTTPTSLVKWPMRLTRLSSSSVMLQPPIPRWRLVQRATLHLHHLPPMLSCGRLRRKPSQHCMITRRGR